MKQPNNLLKQLGLSDAEAQTYLAMSAGAKSVPEIIKVTALPRPTVYYSLNRLYERGLVSKNGLQEESTYTLEPTERLISLAKAKSEETTLLEKEITELVPTLNSQSPLIGGLPHVAFYEGIQAVKNVVMESLYCKDKVICSIAPQDNFFQQLGVDFVDKFLLERIRQNIKTRNLWERNIDSELYKQYYTGLSEVRILPEIMHKRYATTIFLYDDKVMYVASKASGYCLLVTSQEHRDTMQAIFDGLWDNSTPHS